MKNSKLKQRLDIAKIAPILFLLLIAVFYSIFATNFLTGGNLMNILRQVSVTGVMAVAVTFVILLGEIDLSIGTVMAFSGMIVAGLCKGNFFGMAPWGVVPAILVTLIFGAVVGFISGILCSKLRIPGFMVTLSMQYICKGLMLQLTRSRPITGLPDWLTFWGSKYIFGSLPVIIVVFLAIVIISAVLLKYTTWGRNLYAVGCNMDASRMAGLDVVKTKTAAFIYCSVMCAIAGILMNGRVGSAQVTAGDAYQMTPIAGAVLGGASLAGGKGTMLGTIIGVVVMGTLTNGLNLMGVSSQMQDVATGLVILVAVAFNTITSKRSK